MTHYADTGWICSLYAPDANTRQACEWMEAHNEPVYFSWLNQVEFRNALRLRVFRKEISPAQRDHSLNLLLADINTGIFQYSEFSHGAMLIEAERLSAQHSESLGTRSLDVLHVAIAVTLGCKSFLSFDKRQVRLAKASGLRVTPVK